MKRQLTKREYLGEGYVHQFRNDETGEMIYVPCTKGEYERMGQVDGAKFNPVLEGYTWVCSGGGTLKVDTPDTMLGEDEYCIKDGKVYAWLKDVSIDHKFQVLSLDAVDAQHNLDEEKTTLVKAKEVTELK